MDLPVTLNSVRVPSSSAICGSTASCAQWPRKSWGGARACFPMPMWPAPRVGVNAWGGPCYKNPGLCYSAGTGPPAPRPPGLRLWTSVWWEGAAPGSASWALCTGSWPQFPHQLGGDTLATLQEVMYEEVSGRVEYVICTCENLLFLLGNCQQRVFPQRGESWGLSVCSLFTLFTDQLVHNSG